MQALKQSFRLLSLYYSSYNLTQRLQFAYETPPSFEHCFCANYLYTLDYKNYPFELLTKFIFGFVETRSRQAEGVAYSQTVVSRGNYSHFGRRWLRRGLSPSAHAANHFETEYILEVRRDNAQSTYSFLQLRGSIPLLWSQTPNFRVKPETRTSSD